MSKSVKKHFDLSFVSTHHQDPLLNQLKLRDELLLLQLQLLQGRRGGGGGDLGLVRVAVGPGGRGRGCGLHHMRLLQEIDLKLLLELMHQLFQLFPTRFGQLLLEEEKRRRRMKSPVNPSIAKSDREKRSDK